MVTVWWAYATAIRSGILLESERMRVARFVKQSDRELHATSYFLRRVVLAHKTSRRAECIRFASQCPGCGSAEHGPPRLFPSDDGGVRFSVSHSGNVALVAVARGIDLAVDIEHAATRSAWNEIGSRVAHPRDNVSVSGVERWTAKEAALKLTGFGLTIPMTKVVIERTAGRTGRTGRTHINYRGRQFAAWITWFDVDASFKGAVASSIPSDLTVVKVTL